MTAPVTHISQLKHDPNNPRRHTPRNIGMIQHMLQLVGPARSIVIDEHNEIIAGNGVVEAAAQAGIEHVREYNRETGELGPPPPNGEPAILAVRVTGLTDEQKRQYAVADNRTTDLSGWDASALQKMLDEDVDLSGLFFDDELGAILETLRDDDDDDTATPDDFPSFDDDLDTEYCCPKCGYEWSGKPK
ncbi:hypothetical protein [Microbacterium sp.]|uniref:hypothetical protein n=1 Tax=Microbacterium sp. TaxID=51671 RepID=UPI0026043F28|nr:hypothetical protein [Microbacterium sp.]